MGQKPKSTELDVLLYTHADVVRATVNGVDYCFVNGDEYPAELLKNEYINALCRQGYFNLETKQVKPE